MIRCRGQELDENFTAKYDEVEVLPFLMMVLSHDKSVRPSGIPQSSNATAAAQHRGWPNSGHAWDPDHTSTLDTVNDLGVLYADHGKLDAEKLYQRALQGYEKPLGHELVKTYTPALNASKTLPLCTYKQIGRVREAEEMYSRALRGADAVFGHSSERYQDIAAALEALHSEGGRYSPGDMHS